MTDRFSFPLITLIIFFPKRSIIFSRENEYTYVLYINSPYVNVSKISQINCYILKSEFMKLKHTSFNNDIRFIHTYILISWTYDLIIKTRVFSVIFWKAILNIEYFILSAARNEVEFEQHNNSAFKVRVHVWNSKLTLRPNYLRNTSNNIFKAPKTMKAKRSSGSYQFILRIFRIFCFKIYLFLVSRNNIHGMGKSTNIVWIGF